MACIAVTCMPAEVAVCRGQQAVTCNSAGNDFELVECPLGCDVAVGGCRACATDNDCTTSSPICDQSTSQCRGCVVDTECESSVCGGAACVAEASIVYASSNGSSVATGTLLDPASISRAIVLATMGGGTPKIVRLLPGAYSTPIEVLAPTPLPLEFVATGATISASGVGVRVRGGATVKIRGISVTAGNQAVLCGANGDLLTTLTIEDSVFFENTNVSSGSIVTTGCAIKLTAVESRSTTSGTGAMTFATGSRLIGDRLYVHGRAALLTTLGSQVSVRLTNSVLDDVVLVLNTNDSSSDVYLGFNTIVMEAPLQSISCDMGGILTAVFENNIILANGAPSAVAGTGCSLVNNLLLPQPGAPAGNIVADPQFVDAAARNFKLRSTSPALGAASTTPTIFTDHDFEGRSRPQGAATDIGAFEQ